MDLWLLKFLIWLLIVSTSVYPEDVEVDCSTLRMGQYLCPDPNYDYIDPKTQTYRDCRPDNKAKGQEFCKLGKFTEGSYF